MRYNFERIEFDMPKKRININSYWQLGRDNKRSRDFAQPLFDIGIDNIDMLQSRKYESGCMGDENSFLTLVVQGQLEIQFDKKKIVQKTGMISFIPKDAQYKVVANDPSWWVTIKLLDKPIWEPLLNKGFYIREYESMDQFIILISRIFHAFQKQTINSRLNSTEDARSFAALIKRERRLVGKKQYTNTDLLEQLVSKIELDPEESWTIPKMAKMVNLSQRSLHRFFQREYCMGPVDFVINKRLDRALELLIHTDDKIEAIASSVGYKSLYSFSNLFVRRIGMRPGEFRKNYSSGL